MMYDWLEIKCFDELQWAIVCAIMTIIKQNMNWYLFTYYSIYLFLKLKNMDYFLFGKLKFKFLGISTATA